MAPSSRCSTVQVWKDASASCGVGRPTTAPAVQTWTALPGSHATRRRRPARTSDHHPWWDGARPPWRRSHPPCRPPRPSQGLQPQGAPERGGCMPGSCGCHLRTTPPRPHGVYKVVVDHLETFLALLDTNSRDACCTPTGLPGMLPKGRIPWMNAGNTIHTICATLSRAMRCCAR